MNLQGETIIQAQHSGLRADWVHSVSPQAGRSDNILNIRKSCFIKKLPSPMGRERHSTFSSKTVSPCFVFFVLASSCSHSSKPCSYPSAWSSSTCLSLPSVLVITVSSLGVSSSSPHITCGYCATYLDVTIHWLQQPTSTANPSFLNFFVSHNLKCCSANTIAPQLVGKHPAITRKIGSSAFHGNSL